MQKRTGGVFKERVLPLLAFLAVLCVLMGVAIVVSATGFSATIIGVIIVLCVAPIVLFMGVICGPPISLRRP